MKLFFWKKKITLLLVSTLVLLYGASLLAGSFKDISQLSLGAAGPDYPRQAEVLALKHLPFKDAMGEIFGAAQRLMGKRETLAFRLYQDGGVLYYGASYHGIEPGIGAFAKRVRRLQEYAQSQGKELLFVLVPYKIVYGIHQPEAHLPINDPNEDQDEMLKQLYQNGVPFVDLRNSFRDSGAPFDRLFFKTEVGPTPYAGFLSAVEIQNQLREQYALELDPDGFYTDPAQYEEKTFENSLLGNMGRQLGKGYTGVEDVTILRPKFETKLIYRNLREALVQVGSVTETLVNEALLSGIQKPEEVRAMNAYMGGCLQYEKIRNLAKSEGARLLILRDDAFSTMAPILAPMCSEMTLLNLNSQEDPMDFDAVIQKELANNDVIIVELSAMNLAEPYFPFFQEAGS